MNASRLNLKCLCVVAVILQGCDSSSHRTADSPVANATTEQSLAIPNAPWPSANEYPVSRLREDAAKISDSELQTLMRQGFGGDPLSAFLVAEYHSWQRPPDKHAEEKWRLIAAENGEYTAAVYYAMLLELKGGEENCLRAKFWRERAAMQLRKKPELSKLKNADPARIVGLLTLRDNWQQCLDGNASGYIGVSEPLHLPK